MSQLSYSAMRDNTSSLVARNDAAELDAIHGPRLVTAIPCGKRWRVKVIGFGGSVALLGSYGSRLVALGAAVLLSEQCGARVIP
jgi:hypothetical protein